MTSLNTISTTLAKRLHEASALRGVSIIGVPGGWSVLFKVGMTEKPLGTQRNGRVRQWRSLDTLINYLRDELGIVKIDGVDASGYSAAKVLNTRPDVARKMKQADAGQASERDRLVDKWVGELKGMVPAPEKPVPVEAIRIDGQTLKEMIEDGRM